MNENDLKKIVDERLREIFGNFTYSTGVVTFNKSIGVLYPSSFNGSLSNVYPGVVDSSGTIYGPVGWSASRSGPGDYTVNMYPASFDFGTAAVIASCDSSCYVNVQLYGTTFRLLCLNASGTATDANVNFVVIPIKT